MPARDPFSAPCQIMSRTYEYLEKRILVHIELHHLRAFDEVRNLAEWNLLAAVPLKTKCVVTSRPIEPRIGSGQSRWNLSLCLHGVTPRKRGERSGLRSFAGERGKLSPRSWKILQRMGRSRQRPAVRARERDEQKVVQWKSQTWEEVKRDLA